MTRDSDATRRAAAKTPVPKDLQARAEGIAKLVSRPPTDTATGITEYPLGEM